MITDKQRELAKKFSNMHTDSRMFVLPNVWDAGSAYVFEKQGFRAVATSSAGVAYARGYPDGKDITIDDLALCVEQITRRIYVPLSVDFERGYGDNVAQIKDNARNLLCCGAVGFNIEDGRSDGTLDELSYMLEKIKVIAELKEELGLDFVINARTCTYWLNVADENTKMQIALERGNAFRNAGADCVFIPGAMDEVTVTKLVKGIDAPLNIILNPIFHDFARLEKIGVRRLSVGSGPVRSVYHYLIDIADDLMNGKAELMLNHPFAYGKANEYFTK
ncbi:isocitrate lyase/phosphoenolpyruvate mutase family protein [Alkaliphilus sp. MSJ-5]|uniref:Isocitrate lyase/phosphoenolpyruvate mutase family protein n=1 Tax=Alkaliphilus flagellatus TaxID=2841507 RepID=A0ABS6FYY2_9FIRM|nr:isocitrate lyase/phosphoenolpyruvate mutase family protein [Alkaliphilus flagellatus]MBU5675273.1 isocitrate lyase/phosphoenolpyruvate mutase family protein [Alkaliphilus flagellatus]